MSRATLKKKRLWRRLKPAVVDPAHRYRVRRRRFRTVGAAFLVLAGAYGIAAAYGEVRQSRWFSIERVEVEGLHHVPRAEIESYLGIGPAATLLEVDLEAVRDRLLVHPWIEAVHARKSYPDTLTIGVTERRPVAAILDGGRRYLVDTDGRALGRLDKVPPEWSEGGWPTLVGIELASLQDNDARAVAAFRGGMNLVELVGLDDLDRSRPVRIDLSRNRDVVVEWGGFRILLGDQDNRIAWRRFRAIYPDMLERKKNAREIDLRFPDQVIVR